MDGFESVLVFILIMILIGFLFIFWSSMRIKKRWMRAVVKDEIKRAVHCPYCGVILYQKRNFCPECGRKL